MQSSKLQFVMLLLYMLMVIGIPVSGLYFPQSNLTLRLPYLTRHTATALPYVKLIGLRTLRNDSTISKDVKYRLHTFPEKIAILQDNTENIVLQSLPKNGALNTIVVEASEKNFGEAVLEVTILPVPVKTVNCTNYVQDICFWNTSKYKIYENQPNTMIGILGPETYNYVCPDFKVTRYELLNGTDYFYTVDNKLFAKASLDRDIIGPPGGPGPRVMVHLNCVVWDEKTGIQYLQTNVLTVDVLDQDDNPPISQTNSSVFIKLQEFTEGDRVDESDLILTDADAVTTNQYTIHLFEDTFDVFDISHNALSIDHPNFPNKAPSTAIYVVMYAKRTLLPKSPYSVILQATDKSLQQGYGANSVNISITFSGPEQRVKTTAIPLSIATRETLSYPTIVKIARISPRYFRVAKPAMKPHSSITFALEGSKAFNITQKEGIIYVYNETQLRLENTTVPLKLKWSGPDGRVLTKMLRVNLINVSSSKIDTCKKTPDEMMYSCAKAKSRDACEKFCGIASGIFSKGSFVGHCVWRGNESAISQISEYYSTCSPDLAHCPNNECDELERNDPRICPQDCILESDAHFAQMNKDGRGIKKGVGICSCDDFLKCTCQSQHFSYTRNDSGGNKKDKPLKQGKESNDKNEIILGARKASNDPCGPTCMMGVIGASLFVLIVIIGSFVIWRYRSAMKGARRGCKHRMDNPANGIGILPSDYIDRGNGLLIGLDTFAAANHHHHLLLPKTCPPDPKWEFPRSRLSIEQVLGEGEFGRVLRAKAIDIGGWPGPTTVAVKTLKEDACASELADLLSEYQLLKEAQHPNVIRLLGACTTPDAPVYLIIEFAEYGSLRNYLRRSRHLESEDRMPCSTSLLSASPNKTSEESRCIDNASNYTITPRDILSFAWQISKGMAYLADIKLVHRDLAARNVLLATGKVCKISDFGLTRDVYEDDAYLKRSKGRVPVKWMAPESLADHVYTSKSDVWSFGVLLWELVTLGASPYPGVDVHNLYNLLKAGYRMERPVNCSPQLYKLMLSCWHQEANMRPSFKELTCHWERMLEDGIEYLDLNPRTVHNQAYFASLHALDSPNGSGDEQTDNRIINNVKTNNVNYLGRMSSEPVTKCDKVDKLQEFWQTPIASFPEEASIKPHYVNDRSTSLNANHYEKPIKLRNISIASDSENDLGISASNEHLQSYIDMQGRRSENGDLSLLVFENTDGIKNDNNATD